MHDFLVDDGKITFQEKITLLSRIVIWVTVVVAGVQVGMSEEIGIFPGTAPLQHVCQSRVRDHHEDGAQISKS